MLVDPAVSVRLPLAGLRSRRVPCVRAGQELLFELGGIDCDRKVHPVDPTRLADRPDEWWARVCYALALLVELYRAFSIDGSRLMRLGADARAADLLALANDDEAADLIAMRDLARECLLPALPPGPVTSGMTFDGSRDLNADGDLIAGGVLVDFKAIQGNKRANGTRTAGLALHRPGPTPRLRPDGLQRHLRPAYRGHLRHPLRALRGRAHYRPVHTTRRAPRRLSRTAQGVRPGATGPATGLPGPAGSVAQSGVRPNLTPAGRRAMPVTTP
jgi:hypothetical protein